MTILFVSSVDAIVVLGLALVANAILRRRSAALRHAILAAAIGSALLMPVFELFVPQLPAIRWDDAARVVSSGLTVSPDGIPGSASSEGVPSTHRGAPWTTIIAVIWLCGAIVTCAGLLTGLMRLARLRRRCVPVLGRWRVAADELARDCGVRRHVALLQSDDPSLLLTCGPLRPGIILPAGASAWAEDRMRIVLRHELAHIKRHDAAIQIVAETLRILQWFNPVVWIACRRLRLESEHACDDAVLDAGVEPTEYADQLLEVARRLSGRDVTSVAAPAIAQRSTLERRIVAMLQPERERAPVGARGWAVAACVAATVSIPLAAVGVAPVETGVAAPSEPRYVMLTATADAGVNAGAARQAASVGSAPAGSPAAPARPGHAPITQATASIGGTLLDQTGGTLPAAQLTLTDTQAGTQLTTQADATGRFVFSDLRPARYELVASLPGFAMVTNVLTVAAGAALQRTITMPLGTIRETVTVSCSANSGNIGSAFTRFQQIASGSIRSGVFAVLSAQQPPAAAPARVGGNVRVPRKLTHTRPVCPPAVPATETAVRVTGRVGVDGIMNDVKTAPAEAGVESPRELVESALDAVRQWKFSPTLLNGQPVEVNITVDVVFTRE
jgi:beta-lactamase regulating signal transducer with metallopeptidase domain